MAAEARGLRFQQRRRVRDLADVQIRAGGLGLPTRPHPSDAFCPRDASRAVSKRDQSARIKQLEN